jgi:tyrosyl-tRNA synthetase
VDRERLSGEGLALADLLVTCGLAASKGEARRAVAGGGIYLNNHREGSPERMVSVWDCVEGRYLVLRKGRKGYRLVGVRG